MITPADLRAFETEIAELFNDAQIPYPVHLADGNEEQLIEAFRDVRPEDWVLGSWRSHYHCLLKGVPRETLKRAILRGHSIALCFPKYRVLCSAIVGGSIPIAVGIAAGIAARGGSERVHCFMGDMTSESGIAWESIKYARRHDLPVRWVVEDNNLSVCTDTRETWGGITKWGVEVEYYEYRSKYPHAGAGIRVQF